MPVSRLCVRLLCPPSCWWVTLFSLGRQTTQARVVTILPVTVERQLVDNRIQSPARLPVPSLSRIVDGIRTHYLKVENLATLPLRPPRLAALQSGRDSNPQHLA